MWLSVPDDSPSWTTSLFPVPRCRPIVIVLPSLAVSVTILAGNVRTCVCRLLPPNNRHLCLSPTCQECWPDTSATFCNAGNFFGCRGSVGEFCSQHTFQHVRRNHILVDDLLYVFGRWCGAHHIISGKNCHGIVRDSLDLWPMRL
jgi:hypothetical protein